MRQCSSDTMGVKADGGQGFATLGAVGVFDFVSVSSLALASSSAWPSALGEVGQWPLSSR